MSSLGITGAHTVQGKYVDAEEYLSIYQDLDEEDKLKIRVYVCFDELSNFEMKTGFGNEKIKYGYYKIFMDGSLGARGANLFEPYSDKIDESGVSTHSREELHELIKKAYEKNIQVGIHCNRRQSFG